ncbi:MAG: hypothetical protein U1A25_00280 [Candidatus Sungbacteria bacterium]|nr:hypothetical protein [bacterium]MDZ4260080.1 hypothetical protein [Candidatus Sungbacteria bacterium]
MNFPFEKKVLWWAVIIFFAHVAVLFYLTNGLRWEDENVPNTLMSPTPSATIIPTPLAPKNPVKVIEENKQATTVVYENGLFIPHEVAIKNETGCYVMIENKSDADVIVRLGPFDSQKEQGFLYAPVAPGARMAIDPRYGIMTSASFYNKNNQSADFLVHIDATCL